MKKAIRRTLVRAGLVLCSVLGLLQPTLVSALGLGDMEVSSHLYERFNASIPVISETRVDPAQLKVTLASAEDFRRAGISRPYFLTGLKFDLVYKGGKNQLVVTSPDVLREPFLNFLLEVRWPGGKMLKEYTVLVDPPSASQDSSNTAAQPVSSQQQSNAAEQASAPVASSSIAFSEPPTTRFNSEVAPAKKFQGSAADLLPSAKTSSVASSASAQAATSPTKDSIASQTGANEVPPQSSTDSASTAAKTDSAVDSDALVASASSDVNYSNDDDASASTESPDLEDTADNRQLRTDLAKSLENLDKAKVENEQLEQRIQSVETQVEDFERLIELKNKEIDAVTESIEKKQQAAITDTASVATEQSTGNQNANGVSGNSAGGLLELLSKNMLLVAAGVLLIVLLLFMLLRGRKEEYQATVFADDSDAAPSAPSAISATVASSDPAPEYDEVVEQEPEVIEPENEATISADLDQENEAASAVDEPDDPVAEADIYMAYGRHAQAISMLKHAIEDEPQRTDLRLKLLEVLKDENTLDQNTYLVEAQRQQILSDAPELESEVNAILGGGAAAQQAASDEALSLDVELDADLAEPEQPDQAKDAAPAAPAIDSEELVEEVNTKLELARTYFDMGDFNGAKEILLEVVEEGNADQQAEAETLLSKIA